MTKYVPASFDRAMVRDGLLKAMGFGEPTRGSDKAAFHFVNRTQTGSPQPADADGIPFDPTVRPTIEPTAPKTLTCAIEYIGRNDEPISIGQLNASRIRITLLDEEYQQVKDFSYVVTGGEKYLRDFIEPPIALGSLDVWTCWCVSEEER